MADIFRRIKILFDRESARKAQEELVRTLETGGKKAGESFVRELKEAFDKRMALLKVQLADGIIDKKQFKKQAELAAKEFNAGIIKGMKAAHAAGTLTDKEFVKLSRTLKRVGDDGATAGTRIGGVFARLGATLAATFTVHSALRFFKDSIAGALEAEESISRLDSVLRPLGRSYQQVGQRVEGFLDKIQATTKFSDEEAREALTVLIAATGDYEKSLELLDLTAKIAEFRHVSMAEAAKVAADASKGLTRGMRDLGIATDETGDIAAKASKNLGDIAVEAGDKNAGRIKRAINLWGEFKEQIGLAILGTDSLQDSQRNLISSLIDLNKWVQENKEGIGNLTTLMLNLATAIAKAGELLFKYFEGPGELRIKNGEIFLEGGKFGRRPAERPLVAEGIEVPVPGGTATRGRARTKADTEADKEAQRAADRAARRSERDREGLEHDIRVASFMLEEQATRQFAEDEVRKLEMVGKAGKVAFGTLEEGFKRLQDLNLQLAVAGFDRTLIPQVQRTEHAFQMLPPVMETMAAGMQKVADAAAANAERFSTPWIDAMDIIRNEVEGQGTLFLELGEAWAFGGFKGIAELAKHKVKENLAWVIEETAKALGSIGLGNFTAAKTHFASAAKHGLAALAWKGVGASAGGGGSSGSSAGGSAGSSSATSASNLERPESQISIYLTGPGWHALNPEVQRVVHQAGEMARERHGSNTKVRVIRGSR